MSNYLAYCYVTVKEGIAFRINLFTSVFGGVFRLILLTSVWRAIYIGQDRLAGYSEEEILFYIIVAAALNAGGLMSSGTILGERISNGDIAVDMIRPIYLPWAYFFSSLGDVGLRLLIKAVPTFIIGLILIRNVPPVEWHQVAGFILLFMGGSFLHFWLHFIFSSFSFRTKSPFGVSVFWGSITSFLSGLIVPIVFYPDTLQKIISWTPFPSVAYTPIRILMGDEILVGGLGLFYQTVLDLPALAALILEQLSWISIVIIVANRIYTWNEKALEVQGG